MRGFIDGAQIRAVRLIERRDRPGLHAPPRASARLDYAFLVR
jgi:hypothetical protein